MKHIDIFYADDDEDDLLFFQEAVEKIACDLKDEVILHIHINGDSLVESIVDKASNDAIVFLDINMPKKNGFELLQEIKANPKVIPYPVIMYSTSADTNSIKESKLRGASMYVVKPYNFNDLISMISKIVQTDWIEHDKLPENFIYSKDLK